MTKESINYTISQVSENSLLIKYDEQFSTALSVYIARCASAVTAYFGDTILNSIPSYDALLISFKPFVVGDFLADIRKVIADVPMQSSTDSAEIIKIPAYYGHEVAEFMDEILADTGLSLDELIAKHTEKPYFVYMIGFCPGFGYMGEVAKELQMPRRKVPQLKIPAGSVALADFQTSIYPIEMPGGWHIIGRTPLAVFDAGREKPSLFKQGDLVQFVSISREQFLEMGGVL